MLWGNNLLDKRKKIRTQRLRRKGQKVSVNQ